MSKAFEKNGFGGGGGPAAPPQTDEDLASQHHRLEHAGPKYQEPSDQIARVFRCHKAIAGMQMIDSSHLGTHPLRAHGGDREVALGGSDVPSQSSCCRTEVSHWSNRAPLAVALAVLVFRWGTMVCPAAGAV